MASIAAFQVVDLGSIPGRRKDVSSGLEFIQGDLVTPLLDVISPKANPFPPAMITKPLPTFSSSLSVIARSSQRHFQYP